MDDSVHSMWSAVYPRLRGWVAERSGGNPPYVYPIVLRIKRVLRARGLRG